jgi:hypothetical protein
MVGIVGQSNTVRHAFAKAASRMSLSCVFNGTLASVNKELLVASSTKNPIRDGVSQMVSQGRLTNPYTLSSNPDADL